MRPENAKDLFDASDAMQDWCLSQDLLPADAVMVAEMFIARMIAANGTSSVNFEAKFDLVDRSVRSYTAFCMAISK